MFQGTNVATSTVSICASFDEEGWTMTRKEREELEKRGIHVITSLHSLDDNESEAFKETAPNRVVRETLYRFCQGMKVAVEVSLMAVDAEVLDISRKVIAIRGTSEGRILLSSSNRPIHGDSKISRSGRSQRNPDQEVGITPDQTIQI
jgi:hypothetical protein